MTETQTTDLVNMKSTKALFTQMRESCQEILALRGRYAVRDLRKGAEHMAFAARDVKKAVEYLGKLGDFIQKEVQKHLPGSEAEEGATLPLDSFNVEEPSSIDAFVTSGLSFLNYGLQFHIAVFGVSHLGLEALANFVEAKATKAAEEINMRVLGETEVKDAELASTLSDRDGGSMSEEGAA